MVDVGGGTGAMLTELCARARTLRATLVDLPGTVARADGPFETRRPELLRPAPGRRRPLSPAQRAQRLAGRGDRRDPAPLRRGGARASRAIVISGGVAPDDAPRRLEIEMVLLGGRTDTLAAFRERAARAGLEVIAAGPQPAGPLRRRVQEELTRWPTTSSSRRASAS